MGRDRSTEVDHGSVDVKGGLGKTETFERFATTTVCLRKKLQPLVLRHVRGQYGLVIDIERSMRPGLLERLRGTLDAEKGRVELGSLAVTDAGLVLPSPVGAGRATALAWAELGETKATDLAALLIRPRHANDRRVGIRNARIVRDFVEETGRCRLKRVTGRRESGAGGNRSAGTLVPWTTSTLPISRTCEGPGTWSTASTRSRST
ncbi:hypothetical protein [Streptomyces brevispora]|uniref:hypothetical protein n=1 Tax=Streptomyces brevispora TaxID=887462 RepID=UPI0035D52F47